jgi:gluconate 2-dehydrogenase gamma chain
MGTPWADGAIWYMQGPFFNASPEFGYQSPLTPKQQYRLGIKAIDGLCQERLKKPFAQLTLRSRMMFSVRSRKAA